MPLNQQALASLSDWQRQVIENTAGISGAQRQQRGATGAWDAYRAALAGGEPTPPSGSAGGMPPTGGGATGLGGAGGGSALPSTITPDLASQLQQHLGGGALDWNSLALAAGFAGLSQWQAPWQDPLLQGGERGSLPLKNTSKEDIRFEQNAMTLFVNSLLGMNPNQARQRIEAQQALVPEWAAGVDADLRGQGIPFGFELFGDAETNISDPSQPLFGPGDRPTSLWGVHGGQAGEASFLRSLSASELGGDLWPLLYAYYHRPAGAPAPEGFEAGITFGSPQLDTSGPYNPETQTFPYRFSPLMGYTGRSQTIGKDVLDIEGISGTPSLDDLLSLGGGLYNRWAAYGMPGDPTQSQLSQALTAGSPAPREWFSNPYPEGTQQWQTYEDTISRWQQDWFKNPLYEPFANLPEDVRKRLIAVANSPTSSYVG